jgi:hypothetical protein
MKKPLGVYEAKAEEMKRLRNLQPSVYRENLKWLSSAATAQKAVSW